MSKPIVWTIAGSDSGGGAGIQADLHTFHQFDVHGCSVISALTAQNSYEVTHVNFVVPELLSAQIETLMRDLPPRAIKLGMLGDVAVMEKTANFLQKYTGHTVCDPVMLASSGANLFAANAKSYFIENILPQVDLLTPNLPEASTLVGWNVITTADVELVAKQLLDMKVKRVFIKGGHAQGEYCQDYYADRQQQFWLTSLKQNTSHTHGSGCTLSAAIAANLALGYSMADALIIAKIYVNQAIRYAQPYGRGAGPVAHLQLSENAEDFPWLTDSAVAGTNRLKFQPCVEPALGLYPIVNNAQWLQRLLPLGVKTIQLRIKDKSLSQVEREIKTAITLAERYNARLFVNDYWELAIKHGAYGVHLGQEDIIKSDLAAIAKAGLRLGISTHCHAEVARAYALQPSYLACGPVFPTTSKIMSFAPQGLNNLSRWCRILNNYPWVAIGGISKEVLGSVLKAGADGVAVISALLNAKDPEEETLNWLKFIDRYLND